MANHYEKTDEGDIAKVVVTKNERTTLSSFLAKVMAKPLLLCSSSKSDSLCLVLPCFKDGIANIQRTSEKVCFAQVREMSRTVNAAQMKLVEGEEGDKLELPSLMEVLFIVSFIHKGSMFSLIYFIRC